MNFQKTAVRLLAAGLFFASLQTGWAGVFFYEGQRAWKRQDFNRAAHGFQTAEKWDPFNPETAWFLGRSAWELGKSSDKKWLELAEARLEKAAAQWPFYGRVRLYSALVRSALKDQSPEGMTKEEWREIKKIFLEASEKEPGNAWIAYEAGKNLLLRDSFLAPEERQEAVEEIRQSIRLPFENPPSRYLEGASPFLEPALNFLWKRYGDFDQLKSIVPQDRISYQTFLNFADREGLWKYRNQIFPAYLAFQQAGYESECQKAEKKLERGDRAGAYLAFRRAFWMRNWAYLRAKAGILASGEASAPGGMLSADSRKLWKEEAAETLRHILEEKDEELESIIPFLKPAVEKTQDPDLIKLYSSRIENPFPSNELKKEEMGNVVFPAAQWWAPDIFSPRMTRKGRMSMGVLLSPGRAQVRLHLKAQVLKPEKGAYALISLNDREIGGAYVDRQEWQSFDFEIETAGGKRWLQLDYLNGVEGKKRPPSAVLELGDVEVRTL